MSKLHALSKSDLNFSGRKFSNPASWSQWRAFNHIFEEEKTLQGKFSNSAIAILTKSEIIAKRLRKDFKETKLQEGQISSYDWKIKYSPTPSQDRDLISITTRNSQDYPKNISNKGQGL